MRKRLIKLLNQAEIQQSLNAVCGDIDSLIDSPRGAEFIADYLIENGVIVPLCKVGDVVYRIYTRAWIGEDVVREVVVSENGVFYIDDKGRMTSCNKFGKTVFLTREDAEAKLKEGGTNGSE